jgi:NADPH:quinone reductase-like Zn-dependent oxidoreductase
MVNAQIQPGNNVLITGIGGGVAVIAAQLCIARGAHVYVTSGSEDKISRAKELGVKGGVNYKSSKSGFWRWSCSGPSLRFR